MATHLQQHRRSILYLSVFFCLMAGVSLLVALIPVEISALKMPHARIAQFALLAMMGCGFLAAITYAIANIVNHLNGRSNLLALSASSFRLPQVDLLKSSLIPFTAAVIVALGIFGQTIWQVRSPLDWDELDTATRLASPDLVPIDDNNPYQNSDVISPTKNTRNHPMANVATLISFKLFGVSELTARLPAVFFTLAFLTMICTLGALTMSPLTLLFALLHLAVNGMFLWYTHSMRGYISMLLFTGLSYFLLRDSKLSGSRLCNFALILSGVCASLTHSFGSLFYLLLLTSYLFWVSIHSSGWSVSDLKAHTLRLFSGSLAVPFILFILAKQFIFLNKIGYLNAGTAVDKADALMSVLGLTFPPAAWLLLAFLVTLAIARAVQQVELDLSTIFLVVAAVTLFVLVQMLKATLFEARFLLAFVLPFLIWVAETVQRVKNPALRGALVTSSIALLIVMPVLGQSEIEAGRLKRMGEFGQFMYKTKSLTAHATGACITASGEADQSLFTRGLYYHRSSQSESERSTCEHRFHFHFAKDWKGDHKLSSTELARLTERSNDGAGRTLYELTTPAPFERLARNRK